ncbi:MAG: serine/threonine-protein kinase [Gemmataceae bacterium]
MTTADDQSSPATPPIPTNAWPTGPEAALPADLPAEAGRFRVLSFHARGGLGEVLIATDGELPRRVALKRIQPQLANDPARRARFAREAEITGRLEHPGIVPIYGRVDGPDGEPFYAMRFIAGESLRDAIARTHALPSGPDRERQVRQLLVRFVAVCNAVAYAHSQRIVHRDLKPANVMLGSFGETYVVDWGLAKVIDDSDVSWNGIRTDVEQTATGVAAGTPAYMPPEQMRGDHASVGPISDVYALGATLHHLLTGRPPRGPGLVDSGVTPALAAVCRKATASDPADRYASVTDLRADVERWLGDEPVGVYRDPWSEQLRRWARRHRALVGTVVAAASVSLVGLAIGFAVVRRHNVALTELHGSVREALDRATTAITGDLAEPRQLTREQIQQLDLVLPYYRRFAAAQGLSDTMRAGDQMRIGMILYRKHSYIESAEAFRQAAQLFAGIRDDEAERSVGVSLNNRGNALADAKDSPGAETAYREALAVRERLFAAAPDSAFAARDLGSTCYNLAKLLRDDDKPAGALPFYDRAIHVLAPIAPGDERSRLYLQMSYEGRAVARHNAGRYADAATDWASALTLARRPAQRSWLLSHRAEALSSANADAAAVADAESALRAGSLPPNRVYAMALVYAKASSLSKDYADRAVGLARRAIAAGSDGHTGLIVDSEWDALRQLPAFVDLLWDAADGGPTR